MIVTETRLENIANGYLDPDRLSEPFIITRTHNSLIHSEDGSKEGSWAYSFIWGKKFTRDNEIDKTLDITPQLAKKLIKIYEMHVAHKSIDGQIYEMPGEPFKKNFHN